jgi:hypothetical protein
MRVIALEEHFTAPAIAGRIDREAVSRRGSPPRLADRARLNWRPIWALAACD